jgi:hypothetical protein
MVTTYDGIHRLCAVKRTGPTNVTQEEAVVWGLAAAVLRDQAAMTVTDPITVISPNLAKTSWLLLNSADARRRSLASDQGRYVLPGPRCSAVVLAAVDASEIPLLRPVNRGTHHQRE